MSRIVLDSSALIALLRNERGAEVVAGQVRGALISTVNMAEVFGRMLDLGVAPAAILRQQRRFEIEAVPLSLAQAETAAALRAPTRVKGLALGDRVCLALALERKLPVLTGEAMWLEVPTGADIRLFRERLR